MRHITLKRACLLLLLSGLFAGCGSGGSASSNRQQKTATVIFSTYSSPHSAPLEGIQITAKLPAGASVPDISTALIGRNDTGNVGQKFYNANPPTVSFIVMPTSAVPIKFGSFAELKCTIAPGTTLDQSSFSLASSDIQMFGNNSSGSSVDLASQIPVKLSVTFEE
jgi:hypothetical protein